MEGHFKNVMMLTPLFINNVKSFVMTVIVTADKVYPEEGLC